MPQSRQSSSGAHGTSTTRTIPNKKQEHYGILGVPRKATTIQIKKAFSKLILIHHPDKNGSSEASTIITQKLNDAYKTLTESSSRERYDRDLSFRPQIYGNKEYFRRYPQATPAPERIPVVEASTRAELINQRQNNQVEFMPIPPFKNGRAPLSDLSVNVRIFRTGPRPAN